MSVEGSAVALMPRSIFTVLFYHTLQRKFLELLYSFLFLERSAQSQPLGIKSLMPRKFFKALVIICISVCLVIFFAHYISEEWPNPAKIEQEKRIVEAMVNPFLNF